MTRESDIGAFLRAQRARLRPEDAGVVPDAVPRRVPGLRREEVARLAGVSTDYYTRLEQGRRITPSDGVVDAIARALRLDDAGRQHLFDLIRPRAGRRADVRPVRWSVQQLIDSWGDQAAIILGPGSDVLAGNALSRALLKDFAAVPFAERNYARWVLLDDRARTLYTDWAVVGSEVVASLRMQAGRHPHDRRIHDLVQELTIKSADFRTWWADQRVRLYTHGTKRFRHPVVGDLELQWQALAIPGDEDQTIYTYFAEPGTAAAQALRLLASWSAPVTQR